MLHIQLELALEFGRVSEDLWTVALEILYLTEFGIGVKFLGTLVNQSHLLGESSLLLWVVRMILHTISSFQVLQLNHIKVFVRT
jgi:hypothetical protein